MADDAGAVVRSHLDAVNARDLDALMACFGDGATWATGTESLRGLPALEEFFSAALAELSPQLHVQNVVVDGDRVACELREDFTAGGVDRTDHIAGFYRVAAGRITSAKIYREGSAEV